VIDAPATTTFAIRPLTIEELPLCVPFGQAFIEEKQVPGTFSPETFIKNWTLFLSAYPSTIFGLWQDKQLVGGIGGMIHPDLNTGVLCAIEFFWYVTPAYRKTLWAARLPLTFRKWAKRHGAERFRMVHLLEPGEDPAAVKLAEFYTRTLKLRPVEVCFDGPI